MLLGDEVDSYIKKIKDGDESFREKLIHDSSPFIAGVVNRICCRRLSWEHDDELSIGLLAFNEAIDRFQVKLGVPFTAFARLVIRSRVTDYLRKESKWNQISLGISEQLPEGTISKIENSVSWEQYIKKVTDQERREEILHYSQKIKVLGITFRDLVDCSPKHRDTRENLINAAYYLATSRNLYELLLVNNRLPLREIIQGTGISRKVLERGRKYIIAVATLIYYREEFIYLNDYINLPREGDK